MNKLTKRVTFTWNIQKWWPFYSDIRYYFLKIMPIFFLITRFSLFLYVIFIFRVNSRLQLKYLFTYKLSNFLNVKKPYIFKWNAMITSFKMKKQVKQHKNSDSVPRNRLTVHKCNTQKSRRIHRILRRWKRKEKNRHNL